MNSLPRTAHPYRFPGAAPDWEAESSRAAEFGARVVIVRFGIILAKHGGALPKIAAPFRFGAGGRLGSGQQWMSWITLEDIVGILRYALATNLLSGVANGVSPRPVRNVEFAETLGKRNEGRPCSLHRASC